MIAHTISVALFVVFATAAIGAMFGVGQHHLAICLGSVILGGFFYLFGYAEHGYRRATRQAEQPMRFQRNPQGPAGIVRPPEGPGDVG